MHLYTHTDHCILLIVTIFILFLLYKPFTYFGRVTPRYFILFHGFAEGVVFMISFSVSLIFVYRRTTDFCELIL